MLEIRCNMVSNPIASFHANHNTVQIDFDKVLVNLSQCIEKRGLRNSFHVVSTMMSKCQKITTNIPDAFNKRELRFTCHGM